MLEELTLVRRLRRGDKEALREVYVMYKDTMYTVARALLNDAAAAQEVVHDAFVALGTDAMGLGLHASLKNYLSAYVINQSQEILRRKMYKVVEVPRTGTHISQSTDSGEGMTHEEETAAVMNAMAQVPLPQREAVTLHLHGGLSFPDIARVQQVSLNTAQARYHYGIEKLKDILDRQVE